MLLALDARNRFLSLGFRCGPGSPWLEITRLGVSPLRTADEYSFFIEAAYGRARSAAMAAGLDPEVGEAWLSNVVPSLTTPLVEAVRKSFGIEAVVLGPGVRTGVKVRTDLPSEVGSDLICMTVAARELVGKPCLVASFGTVLAIAAIDAAGDFVGAAFAPGFLAAAESLRRDAAQIPEVRLAEPPKAIGKSTVQAVQSGIVIGYGGLLSRLIERMSAELSSPASVAGDAAAEVKVVGTGFEEGRAILEAEGYRLFVPDLVLEGIAIIASR
jgi:type III pantothenate kinase